QRMDSLETIAGGLAHEIRNPLNYVKSALATIQRDAEKLRNETGGGGRLNGKPSSSPPDLLAARMQRMFEAAETGVRRIEATVDLMIRYSRDGYSRTMQPYDAFAAIRDVVAMVLPTVAYDVTTSIELEGDGVIECIPEEFNQILTNVVQNAVEAVPIDGS